MEVVMPLKKIQRMVFGSIPQLKREEALKVFERDHYKCQYCGMDLLATFENWMLLTVDHIHAYARGGAPEMDNQVTACQPCNTIKGTREFRSLEEARKFVLSKRAEWEKVYQEQAKSRNPARAHAAHAG
jgi:5-methylcytosine-specific restriction endonuclease McrA